MLTAISERKIYIPRSRKKSPCSISLPNLCVILASTHEFQLQDALRNRMRLNCRFDYYSKQDLVDIIRQRTTALKWQCESDEVLLEIAKRSKQVPRIALNRHLQMAFNVASSRGSNVITMADTLKAFELQEVDELGLDSQERAYLQILSKHPSMKLNVIASKLLLPRQTIVNVIEPYLLRTDLIHKDGCERVITEKGLEHLKNSALNKGQNNE